MGRARGRERSLPQTMEEGFCRMGLQLGGKRRVPISGISWQWEQPTSPFYPKKKKKKKRASLPPLFLSAAVRLSCGMESVCLEWDTVLRATRRSCPRHAHKWELDGNKYFHLQRTHQKTFTVISFGGSSWCPCSESILLPVLLLWWSCFGFIKSYLKRSLHPSFSTSFK